MAGEQYIDTQEAARLACENPDYSGKDLYDTIANGTPVQYGLYVQLMNPQDEATLSFDPLDDMKVWDVRHFPPLPVGRLVLDTNPTNYQEQIEKLAFTPSNLLDGVELSDDKMLQGRSDIYWDSQRHRLGSDFRKIPINHQANWSPTEQITSGAGRYVADRLVRSDIPKADNFTQAGQFYQSLTQVQQDHLVQNLTDDLSAASHEIQRVVLGYLFQADTTLAEKVARQIAAPKKG